MYHFIHSEVQPPLDKLGEVAERLLQRSRDEAPADDSSTVRYRLTLETWIDTGNTV